MICDHCINNQKIISGVPSCFLPYCIKRTVELEARLLERFTGTVTENLAEKNMINQELDRRKAK